MLKPRSKKQENYEDEYEDEEDEDHTQNKINLDYDWNSEYGDGDIPDIDKQ